MEDKDFEELCSLLDAEETCNSVNEEVSNVYKELLLLVSEIPNDVDGNSEDAIRHQNDKRPMPEIAETEIDSYGHQKADLGKTFSGECSQGSEPTYLAISHSSPDSVFFNLSVNQQTQDGQNEWKGSAKNLVGIYEGGYRNNVHSKKDSKLLESEVEKGRHCIPSNVSDDGSSSTEQINVQRTPNNTSNVSHKITVEDKYLNIFNLCRRDSPSPSSSPEPESPSKLVCQTLVPTAELLELCRSSRNRRTKFYFPVENSPDQESTQAKLPISKLAIKPCNKTGETPD